MENTYVIDRTGRNIQFSWIDVLQTSKAFQPDLYAGGIWNLDGVASISAFGTNIAIHPGTGAAKNYVLDLLAEEIGRHYCCHVTMEKDRWPAALHILLEPRRIYPLQTVCFGNYPQKMGAAPQPVEWLVLDRTKDTLTLLSKYALCTRGYWNEPLDQAYQDQGKQLLWEHSEIRQWLNGPFSKALFSLEEYRQILNTCTVTQPDMDAAEQLNKVFLLSEKEIDRYLPKPEDRVTQATPMAIAQGALLNTQSGDCCWWILPKLDHCPYPHAVLYNGAVQFHSRNVAHRDFCIRPAIRVKAQAVTVPEQETPRCQFRSTRILCPWNPELASRLNWFSLCKDSGLFQAQGCIFTMDPENALYAWGSSLCFYGDKEKLLATLKKAIDQKYRCGAVFTDAGDQLVVELKEYTRKRTELNAEKLYFMTRTTLDGQQIRLSIDVETAADSHYVLEAEVLDRFYACLHRDKPLGILEFTLTEYFKSHSHYDLVAMLQAENIPFTQYHYD